MGCLVTANPGGSRAQLDQFPKHITILLRMLKPLRKPGRPLPPTPAQPPESSTTSSRPARPCADCTTKGPWSPEKPSGRSCHPRQAAAGHGKQHPPPLHSPVQIAPPETQGGKKNLYRTDCKCCQHIPNPSRGAMGKGCWEGRGRPPAGPGRPPGRPLEAFGGAPGRCLGRLQNR